MSTTHVQSGHRSISVDDAITCPDCGHETHLIEAVVRGWMHEMEPGETELQFIDRFFNWNDDGGEGEVECVCGRLLEWKSPPGSMDVVRV